MYRGTWLARPASDLGINRGMMMMSRKKDLSISFCPAFVSLILLFFLYLSFPSCPSKNTPCAADLKTNTSDIKQ